MIFDDSFDLKARNITKLLRAIAGGSDARANRHDLIFNTAAEMINDLLVALKEATAGEPNFAKVALGNAAECGRLEIENIHLKSLVERMTRSVKAANTYYGCYLQDEAEEAELCISLEQHEAARELRDALRIAVAALSSQERQDG